MPAGNLLTSTLPQAKVRRSFPLTSIEKIEYEPDSKEPGPKIFRLFFPTDVMTLQANSREDAKDWVEKIDNGRFGITLICVRIIACRTANALDKCD